jgi:protein ImuA
MPPSSAPSDTCTHICAHTCTHKLAALRDTLARLERAYDLPKRPMPHLSLGVDEIHRHLGAPGLLCGVLHEVMATAYGDRPAALGFVLALIARALFRWSGIGMMVVNRWTLRPFGIPYGRGLRQLGIESRRFILVETNSDKDALWALEEILRSEAKPALVVGAIEGELDGTGGRRLNLAAARSGAPLMLLRGGAVLGTSAAATRWSIGSVPARRDHFGALSNARWRATLQRNRNGRPGEWYIEWDHVAHCFRLVEGMADRPSVAITELRRAS